MKITSIQIALADKPKNQNVEYALSLIDRAPASDLFLLPEIWPCGFFSFDRYRSESEPLEGPTVSVFVDVLPAYDQPPAPSAA